ncbi:uncharacterized protein EI90DRAFT_3053890 [Cantharellus anzutake]|uniref:uncharacterized protein n=1 Tax=Cantharellus anzutake TaxID=1750568 RepID=UPI001908B70C|nr:uncharacterized protein EI90DRAFT_3053890 [Cantharellus anzutake]KAF8332645.1 hypothetical protein EI90DRAFT_3053890 [Cantharellus anzutake]
MIRLTHLRHVALDLDRFYAFLPVSLPLLRHTSETLTSLTVKPSCGWTLLQILERFPSVRRIHYVDQFPNSSSLLNYRPPCPVAFEQIIFTSVSRHGFRPLHWLVSNPDLKLELLEIGSTLPDGVFFDLIISKVGPHLRRLHLYEINDSCIMYLNKCEVLEELVAGCSTPEYDWIPLLQILRSVPVRRLKLVGQSIFPLDDSFPGIFEMLKNLPCIDMVTFAGDDNLSCAFETPEMERHWVKMCRAAGIELNLWHIRDCHEKQYCMESEEVGTSWGMIRPSFGTLTAPQW